MRKSDLTPEALLADFEITFAKVMNYPRNKAYPKELEKLEREILRRLGGNWDTFNEKTI